jgi:hypothetical protein
MTVHASSSGLSGSVYPTRMAYSQSPKDPRTSLEEMDAHRCASIKYVLIFLCTGKPGETGHSLSGDPIRMLKIDSWTFFRCSTAVVQSFSFFFGQLKIYTSHLCERRIKNGWVFWKYSKLRFQIMHMAVMGTCRSNEVRIQSNTLVISLIGNWSWLLAVGSPRSIT